MGHIKITSTPYDDVFRTLLNDCRGLVIPLINEVFGENYTGAEEITFSQNEHFLNQQDGNEEGRVTDASFLIHSGEAKRYHLECQSSADDSMLVRFFEYDTQIALDGGEVQGGVLTVTFPHSAVLFLRHKKSTPDRMKVRMVTPGGELEYGIQVLKSQRYTVTEIFERNLLFLIPFHIFRHEKQFADYEGDAWKRRRLEEDYMELREGLEKLLEQGKISEYTKCTLIDMSNKVLGHIARNYEAVMEGVREIMGGKVLEYEAKAIRNEGIEAGTEKGLEKGMEKGLEKGMEKGIKGTVSILRKLEIPSQTIQLKIQEQYGLSQEESKKYL